jgi:hypothetical protein
MFLQILFGGPDTNRPTNAPPYYGSPEDLVLAVVFYVERL